MFDVLSVDGMILIHQPLLERKRTLLERFNLQSSDGMIPVPWSDDASDLQHTMKQSIQLGCEGLVLKKSDSTYQPGSRSSNGFSVYWLLEDWVKLKADYLDGLGDSVDVVIIGGKYGKGKRKDQYGSFLCAVKRKADDRFLPICCVGSGFSDQDLSSLSSVLHKEEVERDKLLGICY